jgi:hypothetical protein
MLVLLMTGGLKVLRWGGLQWHANHTKLHKNRSISVHTLIPLAASWDRQVIIEFQRRTLKHECNIVPVGDFSVSRQVTKCYLKFVTWRIWSNYAWAVTQKETTHNTHPKIVCELQSKDGNSLIVIAACHWAADIAWNNGNEAGSKQACTWWPQLFCQQVCGDGSQPTATRPHRDAESMLHCANISKTPVESSTWVESLWLETGLHVHSHFISMLPFLIFVTSSELHVQNKHNNSHSDTMFHKWSLLQNSCET